MSGLQDWADLPDGLLHSIVSLLGSFHDLLAFAATCRPWRSAFSSYPSKSTLYTLCSSDPPAQDMQPCSQIPLLRIDYRRNAPPSALDKFAFRGASFGHMIFSNNKSCFVFDVFTGISVSPSPLPIDKYTEIYYGAALTAPLSSPNSHLIVNTGSNFFWRVGSNTWLKRSPRNGTLKSIVVFKGQVFGMDSGRRLFMVHLVPRICVQKISIAWGGSNSMTKWHLRTPWLVACGNMLLMVGCQSPFPGTGDALEAYRLDMSSEPAKWVKIEKLGNWAIFISNDERSQPLSCMNPERWGGRSNCVYCYDSGSGDSIAFELGKPLQRDASKPNVFIFKCCGSMVLPIWVAPSMCCDD